MASSSSSSSKGRRRHGRNINKPPLEVFSGEKIKEITHNFGEIIKEGNFSNIYRGILNDRGVVAVKRYNKSQTHQYKNEKKVYAEFDHPQIVAVIGFSDELLSIVMEHAPQSLHDKIEGTSAISIQTMITIIRQIASAIEYINNKEYIIGELKPENVLLDKNEEIKLCDFGGSKKLGEHMPTFCPHYSAPEVIDRGTPTLTSDIFSLGVIILQMIDRQKKDEVQTVPKTLTQWKHQFNIKFNRYSDAHISVRSQHLVNKARFRIHESFATGDQEKDAEYAHTFIKLGNKCTNFDPKKRLEILEVVRQLSKLR